jgi:hypothetical protein
MQIHLRKPNMRPSTGDGHWQSFEARYFGSCAGALFATALGHFGAMPCCRQTSVETVENARIHVRDISQKRTSGQ